MWRCFTVCLVALNLWNSALCYDEVVHIGIILEEGYEFLQSAFSLAVDRINSDRTLLPTQKLKVLSAVIPEDDAYSAMTTACDWISKGIAAIFGPQSLRSTASVQAVAESAGIPLMPGRWEYRSHGFNTTVYFYPHADTKGYALKAFINDRDWRRLAIIYSDAKALIRVNPVLADDPNKYNEDNGKKLALRVHEVVDISEYKKLFKDLRIKNFKNFLIDCPTEDVLEILNQAEEMGMISPYNNYIFTSLDLHVVDLSKFQLSYCNITTFRVINFDSAEYKKVFMTLESDIAYIGMKDQVKPYLNKTQFAVMYDAVLHFAYSLQDLYKDTHFYLKVKPMTCFSQDSWEQGRIIVNKMKNWQSEGITGYVKLDHEGYRTDFELMESRLTPNEMKLEGLWSKRGFKSLRNYTEEKQETTDLFASKTLIVSSIVNPPYLTIAEDSEPGKPNYIGHSVDLVQALADKVNFTFKFKEVRDGQYGTQDQNGDWNGMVGELIREEADMIVADLTITTSRQEAVDFVHPYMDLGISILFKKSTEKEDNLFSFMSPFSVGVWLYMATATLGVTLILYVMGRFTPYEWLNPHPCDVEPEELENQFTLSETAWVVVGCLLQQGGDIEPKATSTRMASGYWWFFTLIMVSSYTANLAAFLTAGRMEATIRSAEDLVAQQKIQYGCVEGGSTQGFFRKSKASLYSRMWSAMEGAEPSVFMKNNEKGIERVMMGNFAFFMESTTIEYQVSINCNLTMVGGTLDNKRYGIAVPKGVITREILSYHLLTMQEIGIVNILKDKWWKKGGCPPEEESSDTLGLESLGGVFLILLIGLPVACIAVVWEFVWEMRKVPKNKREPICKELCKEIKATVTGKNTTKQAPSEEDDEEKMISKGSSSSSSSSSRSSPSGSLSQNASKTTSKVSKKS